MATTPFKHSRLDTNNPRALRILELLPSFTLSGDIRCEIRHCTGDGDIKYEALSYAWGPPQPKINIIINGSNVLGVTKNCHDALFHLRRNFRRRALWVDAICIDQDDNDESTRERNHQVNSMSGIYNRAETVIVWLGCDDLGPIRMGTRLDLFAIALIAVSLIKLITAPILTAKRLDSASAKMERMVTHGMLKGHRNRALVKALSSPWWDRLWTLQEHIEARHCDAYLGREFIPFKLLGLICSLSYDSECQWLPSSLSKAYSRNSLEMTARSLQSLLGRHGCMDSNMNKDEIQYYADRLAQELLLAAFELDTGRPIDKIYGLWAILRVCFGPHLPDVDYNRTAAEVFEEVTWAWMHTRFDLGILKIAGRPESVDELCVPSWVPAWHQTHPNFDTSTGPFSEHTIRHFRIKLMEGPFAWSYSRNSAWYEDACIEIPIMGPIASRLVPGKLRVFRVRYVGAIIHNLSERGSETCLGKKDLALRLVTWCWLVHRITSRDDREAMISEFFRSVYEPGIQHIPDSNPKTTGENLKDFRILFDLILYLIERKLLIPSGHGPITDDEIDIASLMAAVTFLAKLFEGSHANAIAMIRTRLSGDVERWENSAGLWRLVKKVSSTLMLTMLNHNLCVLDNGKMLGVSNYWCREGDEAFVFPGSDMPFLLRREPEGEAYRLVCPVSVDRLRLIGYQKWRNEGEDLREIVLV